MTYKTRIK